MSHDKDKNQPKSKNEKLREKLPEADKQQGKGVDEHRDTDKKSDLRIKDRESNEEAKNQSEFATKSSGSAK